ncbi:MAG: cupin domain-containing protein [Gammaproteobacteria bacterium]|nr:cupin domain-containing protein [Gammaproteobacteria bacterium]
MNFADLLAPTPVETFFARYYSRAPLHVPGEGSRFDQVFSWSDLNRLVDMTTLWSDRTLKLVLDGQVVAAERYCQPGLDREGRSSMRPVPDRVVALLERGATLILNVIERLSPGIAAITHTLEAVTGGPVVCNAYCSWKERPAFTSHFDVTDVFALQIGGHKRWRIYSGRYENPLDDSSHNYSSFPREHHEQARGEVLEEVDMQPGDLLYIPRGQYHDALASSDASLHLSFGVNRTTGIDLMRLLVRSLPDVPAFRAPLPHFDDREAHLAHLSALASSLKALIESPETADQVRQFQRDCTFRENAPRLSLPGRTRNTSFRVRPLFARLEGADAAARVVTPHAEIAITAAESPIVAWILSRDRFGADELAQAMPDVDAADFAALLDRLLEARVLELI